MWKTMAWEGIWQSLLIQYWYIYYFHQIIFIWLYQVQDLISLQRRQTKQLFLFFVVVVAV